jgi:hypothetical protein
MDMIDVCGVGILGLIGHLRTWNLSLENQTQDKTKTDVTTKFKNKKIKEPRNQHLELFGISTKWDRKPRN